MNEDSNAGLVQLEVVTAYEYFGMSCIADCF